MYELIIRMSEVMPMPGWMDKWGDFAVVAMALIIFLGTISIHKIITRKGGENGGNR